MAESEDQGKFQLIESQVGKPRAQAESRRRQDSLKQSKNSQFKSHANLIDSVSPNRMGSPTHQPQEGKSHRSTVKGVSGAALDASMDVLHS